MPYCLSLQVGATKWHDYVCGTHPATRPPTHPVYNLDIWLRHNLICHTRLNLWFSDIATLGPNLELKFTWVLASPQLASWATKWYDYAVGTATHPPGASIFKYCEVPKQILWGVFKVSGSSLEGFWKFLEVVWRLSWGCLDGLEMC